MFLPTNFIDCKRKKMKIRGDNNAPLPFPWFCPAMRQLLTWHQLIGGAIFCGGRFPDLTPDHWLWSQSGPVLLTLPTHPCIQSGCSLGGWVGFFCFYPGWLQVSSFFLPTPDYWQRGWLQGCLHLAAGKWARKRGPERLGIGTVSTLRSKKLRGESALITRCWSKSVVQAG